MEIRISVRNLVEFILRDGDIDNRRVSAREDAMQQGTRIHRMIQKQMGIEYEAEVSMKFDVDCGAYTIHIEGRADGVMRKDGRIMVDEIKGTYRDLRYITKPVTVHLAQAKCYAYFLMCKEDLSEITVRVTYCNMYTNETKFFLETYSREEMEEFFAHLIGEYRKWADYEFEWKKIRKESIRETEFPFPYREGQKELVGHVYQTICHGKKLYIQAPTGVGKTISTVFPSVRAIGEEKADKIFYLTAKTITRTVAEEAFSLLREKGLRFKTLTITAKEKICPLSEMDCNPEHCPYAKGHYARVNDAIFELITTEENFKRETIETYAMKHEVCPFEMSLDVSLYSDGVICDYNYLFDPYVSLKRYFAEETKGPYLFLVDEAHNLVERGRDMYSAEMVKEDFLALKKLIKPYHTGLEPFLDSCNRCLLKLKKMNDVEYLLERDEGFAMALNRLYSGIQSYMEDHENSPVREALLEFYFMAGRYLDVYERLDEQYVTYTYFNQEEHFCIRQFCVDPSKRLRDCMGQGRASVLFSATFLPIQYYKQLLGGTKEDFEIYAKTAFSPEQTKLIIGNEVTSRYTRRNAGEYRKIAAYISEIVRGRKGNYMVFCPSHQFLNQIFEAYVTEFYQPDEEECLVQRDYMSEEERENFLGSFKNAETRERRMVGFCVLGGIFSEGIDLKGEALIGAVIVGTGLPQVCLERSILEDYFRKSGKDGFDYAYRYPGMNKVLQAAGRVIRTVEDKGVIALLDDRFLLSDYKKMFPREWEHPQVVSLTDCQKAVEEFWENHS